MIGRKNKAQEFTISNETLVRIIAFGLGTILLVRFFENLAHPLTLIFMSFFLALALNQAVNWVSGKLKSKNRATATAIAYTFVVTLIIGFAALVLPPLVNQTREFIGEIPQTVRDLEDDEGFVGDTVRRYELEEQLEEFANTWAQDFGKVSGQAVSVANRVVSNLISIITVLVLTFMMLVEGPRWLGAFWRQLPSHRRPQVKKVSGEMYDVVKNYVNGQVVVAAIGAGFSIVALFIATEVFSVDSINPVAFGGIVFLFSLIPMFGATIAAVVVILFSLFASVPLAITMAIYFIVYQQVENATIQPMIQSKGNDLTPMLVFIAAIIGVGFGGILGAFVAIPAAGCGKILLDDWLETRHQDSTKTA